MTPLDNTADAANGWGEYRRMFLDDRQTNREEHKKLFEKLEQISTQLTEFKTERDSSRRVQNYLVPAVVAGIVTAAGKLLRFL